MRTSDVPQKLQATLCRFFALLTAHTPAVSGGVVDIKQMSPWSAIKPPLQQPQTLQSRCDLELRRFGWIRQFSVEDVADRHGEKIEAERPKQQMVLTNTAAIAGVLVIS